MRHFGAIIFFAASVAGCSDSAAPPLRGANPERVTRGAALFQQHCATCHGPAAQGAADWRIRQADGTFLPPPLNGTGHAWHHAWADLKRTILHGTAALGGKMPAWQEQLSEAEAEDVILWFQTLWGDEVYAAWQEIDQRHRRAQH